MLIKNAQFLKSSSHYSQCPAGNLPEYAFVGRSNVGKSSFINMLTGQHKLAKISSKPGKTQLINHFIVNNSWYLVDLPGYGYARTAKTLRMQWSGMTMDYIENRRNLYYLCVLIDSRLTPQKIDLSFISKLGEKQIPFLLVFTKADKQSSLRTERNVQAFMECLDEQWEERPPYIISSAVTGKGKEEFLAFVENINTQHPFPHIFSEKDGVEYP
ncbi:MAG: YihA family ribosome biogenesis GTP-binding protein [Bacteroidales bacterium]|nr:YihA family ribosome biogenesis GTP-binding protein [Bacteroidales bacterium]